MFTYHIRTDASEVRVGSQILNFPRVGAARVLRFFLVLSGRVACFSVLGWFISEYVLCNAVSRGSTEEKRTDPLSHTNTHCEPGATFLHPALPCPLVGSADEGVSSTEIRVRGGWTRTARDSVGYGSLDGTKCWRAFAWIGWTGKRQLLAGWACLRQPTIGS